MSATFALDPFTRLLPPGFGNLTCTWPPHHGGDDRQAAAAGPAELAATVPPSRCLLSHLSA